MVHVLRIFSPARRRPAAPIVALAALALGSAPGLAASPATPRSVSPRPR